MNNTIFFFFYNLAHQNMYFDNLVIFFGYVFPLLLLFGVCVFIFYKSDIYQKKVINWENFKKLVISSAIIFGPAFIVFLFATFLKDVIHIDRSFVQFNTISPLFSPTQEYSFPSTHASIFSALAITMYFYHKKVGYYFMGFALLIGFARIIAGVHFPIDILGGFVLGSLVAYYSRFLAFFSKNVYNSDTL